MNLIQINTQNNNWEIFLKLSFKYLKELWPKDFKNYETFKKHYSQELLNKIKKGNRGLFLVYDNNVLIGITNVFLTKEISIDKLVNLDSVNNSAKQNNINTINIAKFYIKPEYRFKGYGTKLLDFIIKWGKERSAKYLKIEVDKDQKASNKFWSSFNFKHDDTQKQNL